MTISDLSFLIQQTFLVETKDSKVVPFIFNNIQNDYVNKISRFKKDFPKKPLRVIVLKGRQFGFSTVMLALLFCKCLMVKNTRAAVISHNDEATKKLFRRVRFFANTLFLKPTLDKESEREYSFPKTNSYFYIGTAGSKAWGRGDNLTDVHVSEIAFWPDPATVMNGLLQAVGKTGNVTIETTANGVGNYLHKLWKKSYQDERAAWLALFFKWTNFKEYEMEPESNFQMTDEERQLVKKHPELTPRKLQWRRWKISETEADKGMTPEQIFQQEYPLTPREAFISSGRSVFSLRALEEYEPKPPIDEEDGMKIWKRPSGYSVMAIDASEGLENHDRTVIDIYDENLEQVAQWAGWCDTDEGADKAVIWAKRYNSFIICEINNMGIAIQNRLRKKYPVSMQYHRESFDEISRTKVQKLGWRTTGKTKPRMVADAVNMVRRKEVEINCAETIDECMSFIKNGRGGYEADTGANDDRVITLCLAIQAYQDRPPRTQKLTPEERHVVEVEKLNAKWRKLKIKKYKTKHRRKTYA